MNVISSRKARSSSKVLRALLLSTFVLCSVLPARSQLQLPEGNGKKLVETRCTLCHGLNELTDQVNLNGTDWQEIVNLMVAFGAPLSKDEIAVVTDYLAKNFAGTGRPAGLVISGPVEVRRHDFPLKPGLHPSRPHVAADGSIWYVLNGKSLLGRYDPKTGQSKEYPFKTQSGYAPGAHNVISDKEGNFWFTPWGYIGKLNPKTGEVTEYPIPDRKAHRTHTLVVDPKGNVFFTSSVGSMVGRVLAKTGEVKVVPTPTPNSSPYDMEVNSKGIPFFSEFYTNKVASIDPETMEIREYELAHPGARPKRIGLSPDDVLWYADYARGYIGSLDPKTGKTKEWPLPGGRKTKPYGLTVAGDIVWTVETNTRPVTTVRFDTKTEKFQTWLLPSGTGVSDMEHTPNGSVWMGRTTADGGVLHLMEVRSGSR